MASTGAVSSGGMSKISTMPNGLTVARPSAYNDCVPNTPRPLMTGGAKSTTLGPGAHQGAPGSAVAAGAAAGVEPSGNMDHSQTGHTSPADRGSEPMLGIAAQDLISDGCGHCGWIRKLGGNVHNWKRRYMVLKKGCIYYYKDDSASIAKGQFSLNNYSIEPAQVPRMNWCFKLVHSNPKKRTYFVSASSEPELQVWLEKVRDDIRQFCMGIIASPPPASPTNTLPGVTQTKAGNAPPTAPGSTAPNGKSHQRSLSGNLDPDDDSSDGEGVYDKAFSDATPFDPRKEPAPAPPVRAASVRKPNSTSAAKAAVQRSKTTKPFQPTQSTSPLANTTTRPTPPVPFSQRQPTKKPEAGSPKVPPRHAKTSTSSQAPQTPEKIPPPLPGEGEEDESPLLPSPAESASKVPPPLPPQTDKAEKESVESASLNSDEEAARDYLHLTDDLAPPLPFEEPELPQDASHAIYINTARALTPMQKGGSESDLLALKQSEVQQKSSAAAQPAAGRPTIKPRNKVGLKKREKVCDGVDAGDDGNDSDSGYIHPDVGEYLPKSAFHNDMDREKANVFLQSLSKTGCYIIRGSTKGTSEAKQVLSVWTGDRCRHYKIFYRKGVGFSLHGDKTFPDVPTLLAFYHMSNLPRCEHKLSGPYQGVIKM